MKLGNIDPQVSIDYDTTEKIFEHTVTTADTNAKLLSLFNPSSVLDQDELLTSGGLPLGAVGNEYGDQSFQQTGAGECPRVDVELKISAGSPTGDVNVYIYSDSGGDPDTLLATSDTTLDASTVTGSFASYTFLFSSAAILTTSTTYHLVIAYPDGDASNHLHFAATTGNPYANGVYQRSADNSTWTYYDGNNTYDIGFRTYVSKAGTADTGQTITFVGTAQIDTAQYKIGTSSLLLDGNSDYVTVPDSADWDFGTGDFTFDTWVRFANVGDRQCILDISTRQIEIDLFPGGTDYLSVYLMNGAASTFAWSPSVDTWYHVALTRSGTNLKAFIDGTQIGSTVTNSTDITGGSGVLALGRENGGNWYFNGNIDAARITKGTALWTANFTPPTTPNDYVTATSISIFGLEGDTDEVYELDCNIVNGYSGAILVGVRPNNDTTDANYGFQQLYGGSTTIAAQRGTSNPGIYIASISTIDYYSQGKMIIYAKSGYVRTALNKHSTSIAGTTVTYIHMFGSSWNNSGDEITSLNVVSNQTGGLGIGSVISLYRKVSAA